MRLLVVDDEPAARERLRRLLGSFEGVEIVGEAEDGESAMERIEELDPDVVFLDIQMPGISGLEVAASLKAPGPRIIFCTAYEQHAVDAFELDALDYLLKPVNRARLGAALKRAGESRTGEASPRAHGFPTRFLAKRRSRYCVVPTEQVLYFASEGGLTKLQAEDGHYWVQPTLTELESRLDPAAFFRVSRAALVHLPAVKEVLPDPSGTGEVEMKDGEWIEVSRRRFKPLLEWLAGS